MSDFGAFNDDPTADFLAREKAALGDDADFFSGPNPADEFGGFDAAPSFEAVSNFNAAPSFDANASFTSGTSFDAGPILAQSTGQGFSPVPSAGSISQPASYTTPAADYSAFESEFPAAEDLETSQVFANVRSVIPEVEPEVIREWRERQQRVIAERDADSEQRRLETVARAREAIDKFYDEYNEKKQKNIEENRRHESAYLATRNDTTSGTVWDRVTREVDLSNPKANRNVRDTARLKQLMLDLKKDSKAPGTIVSV